MVRLTLDGLDQREALEPGTRVEVRRRFDQAWASGFVIHEATDLGYRLRRTSDGAVLPVAFPDSEIRSAS